jgi:tetratricopeptide (TPR) repeat protein
MYLLGVALHRAGRHEEALARLLAAIERDGRLRHGHPYFVAGETLLALKRWDDAADAFERYLDFSSSDVAAHTCLARAHAGAGDAVAAKKWLLAGLAGWHGLPGALKRRQLGAYLRAQWARISVLKDVGAAAVALLLLLFVGFAVRSGYPLVAKLWQPNSQQQELEAVQKSAALCGSQQTGAFVGAYDAVPEPPDYNATAVQLAQPDDVERRRWQKAMARQYADFHIVHDRIVSGREVVQEFCLTRVISRSADALHAEAVLRFRRGAPAAQGGAPSDDDVAVSSEGLEEATAIGLFDIRLNRGAEATRFSFAPLGQPLSPTLVTLRRR